MKKETVVWAMLATATYATAQNGKFPTSGVSADSVQTEKDSIKANQEAEIKADKEAEIQAVTVTGHRPMYKMRNDALVTRVRNTPLAKEPTLDDVLKHIPGMKQTADGTLEVNGLGAPTIYLNDKKATSTELSHLDVKLIDEIELITTPGAKYDATTGAVLRILTRRTDEGIFGKMQVYDKLSEVNTNHEELTLGWVTKKISLTGFYGYTDNRYNVHQPQEALVRAKDGEYLFGTDRHGKNKANYNATELNFDWLLSKQHEVGIQWEGLWLNGGRSEKQQQYYRYPNPAGEDTNREMKLSDADGEMKYVDAESQQWGHQRSHHFNLFHLAKWSKHFSSQIYLDYARNKDSDSQPITEKEGSEMQETLNRSNSNYDIYSGRIEVKQLISDKHSINYGGEWSLMEGKGKTESSADMLGTTEYKNHDTKTAAYLQYQGEAGRWSWWAGIRYEHLTSRYTNLSEESPDNMERHYDQWFPSFGITLKEPSWHHSLSFRTTTARPSFSQLSGNIYYISRFQYQISNPKLQPVNTYRLTYSVQWKDFMGMLRYTRTDHSIMYIHEVPEDKPVRYVSTFMNFNKIQKYMAYLNWGHVFGCWRPNVNASITYQRFSVNDHGELISYNGATWNASFDNYFTLPNDYQLSLSYSFDNGGQVGKTKFRPTQNWSLGANKSWMDGRLQVAFSANDLFHQQLFKERIHEHAVDFSQTEDYKLWSYKLTVTWKFNKRKGRYNGMNSAEDELNRL